MANLFKWEAGKYGALMRLFAERLTIEEGEKLLQNPGIVDRMVATLRVSAEGHPDRGGLSDKESEEVVEYLVPLTNAEVPAEHQETLAKYRRLAIEHGVASDVPLCYKVRAGFTLKKHAPQAGPCREGFRYLQDWNFKDEPTRDALVFWVPRLLKDSTSKTVDEQMQLLSALRQYLALSEHHLSSFGEISLVAGLILAHFKATGERVPVDALFARSDTCFAGGNLLHLGDFCGRGLDCDVWYWVDGQPGNIGVFALGVDHVIRE